MFQKIAYAYIGFCPNPDYNYIIVTVVSNVSEFKIKFQCRAFFCLNEVGKNVWFGRDCKRMSQRNKITNNFVWRKHTKLIFRDVYEMAQNEREVGPLAYQTAWFYARGAAMNLSNLSNRFWIV